MHASGSQVSIPVTQKKYVPIFELGRGGMGNAVLAVVKGPGGFNKLQVVKQLRPELADTPEFLSMFLDEARLSARINHPNVVQTNEVGFDGTTYFIAMEYLEGQSLEALLTRAAKRGKLPLPIFLRILIDTCSGLHHAHELQDFDGKPLHVVHRDVSPHNIFVTYDGQSKLLDFGIAKATDSSSETRTGIIKGKVVYMAPEQFRGSDVDRRVDVFAMGAILWRLLAGRRLWKGMSDIEVYQQLAAGSIPSPTEVDPDAPPELVAICLKALAPDREQRHQSAAELQMALEDYLDKLPEKSSQRAIGAFVRELFEDRRAQIRNAIETRLASAIIDVPSTSMDLPQLGNDFNAPASLSNIPGPPGMPSLGPSSTGGLASGPMATPAVAVAAGEAPSPAARRSPVAPIAIGIGLALALAGAFVVWRTPPAVPPTPTTVTTPTPPEPAAQEMITINITPTPADAQIFLDDAPISGRSTKRPHDGASHTLRVEAPGYVTFSKIITFDQSFEEAIPLDKEVVAVTPTVKNAGTVRYPTGHAATARAGGSTAPTPPPTEVKQPDQVKPAAQPTPAQPTPAVAHPTNQPAATPAAPAVDPTKEFRKAVNRAVASRRSDIEACFARARVNNAQVGGVVSIAGNVNASGSVPNAAVSHSTANYPMLENCLVDRFRSWTFPVPTDGVSNQVSYTFKFED